MTRVALYARVSTTDQHPEIQLNALPACAEARSLEVAEVYVDVGFLGRNRSGPRSIASGRCRRPLPGIVESSVRVRETSCNGVRCEGQKPLIA